MIHQFRLFEEDFRHEMNLTAKRKLCFNYYFSDINFEVVGPQNVALMVFGELMIMSEDERQKQILARLEILKKKKRTRIFERKKKPTK